MAGRVLSTRYIPVEVTTPTTPRANPLITPIALGEVTLEEIQLTIPRGHNGQAGIQFRYADVPIVPWNDRDGWIRGDGAVLTFIVGFDVSNGLTAATYNLDTYDHTFHCLFKTVDIARPDERTQIQIVPIG